MNILGISCFYHDSAACLLQDGEIIGAVQEERFTRKKHDADFPVNAIHWCLDSAGISVSDLDCVVFYDKPLVKFERILETQLFTSPLGVRQFVHSIPLWLKQKLWIPNIIEEVLGYRGKVLFSTHHESHAASAFFPSPFKEAAFLTMDGVGEWETTSLGIGKDNYIEILQTLNFPHSLGLFYSAFTYYTGFRVNSGEYKLMGLAPYGEPRYTGLILDNLLDIKEDGSFKLNMKYFGYCYGLRMINWRFEKLFGAPPRKPETEITQLYMDIAASVQKVTEEIMLRMARYAKKVTGQENLCLAGGVALNCVGNGRILKENIFKQVWIQSASGDAGGALGAALLIWHKYLGNKRNADGKHDKQKGSFLGPSFSDVYIEDLLVRENITFKKFSYRDIPGITADLITEGNVVGWFQGALEFGPRALGARSIIADARNKEMQSRLNLKIKFRESFRPFAPTILQEYVAEWFDLETESPYMLLTASLKENKKVRLDNRNFWLKGFDMLKAQRSIVPAITHVDYSARIQTVNKNQHGLYYETIKAFYEKTGCPMIINTSFNVRGEPLVCAPEDALRCFLKTDMDYLVMGCFLLDKKCQQPLKKYMHSTANLELD